MLHAADLGTAHAFADRQPPPRGDRARQVHGIDVWVVEASPPPGAELPAADALITRRPGHAVSVFTADCVPILLHDPDQAAVAAIHAGWRGMVGGIIEATWERLGRPAGARAALGPAISRCCFEVGDEVAQLFPRHRELRLGRWYVDLLAEGAMRLAACGIQVLDQPPRHCTKCGPFPSFRRDGPGGPRMFHWIRVPDRPTTRS